MTEIEIPAATARRILAHSAARFYLPQFYGRWEQVNGEVVFIAKLPASKMSHFLEGLARLEAEK